MKTAVSIKTVSSIILLILSFVEGAVVMSVELCSARMLTPYYGVSMFVWASVLTITLLGLALGYFLGGYYSKKSLALKVLLYVLFVGAFFLSIMPFVASQVFYILPYDSIVFSLILGAFLLMFFPLVCMGMVSPLIIQLLSENDQNSGYAAGRVYAISTVGGIVATFSLGFYLIPNFGVAIPIYIMVILLLLFTFLIGKKMKFSIFSTLFFLSMLFLVNNPFSNRNVNSNYSVRYKNESVMGQVLVVSQQQQSDSSTILFLNRVVQTKVEYSNSGEIFHLPYIDSITKKLVPYVNSHKSVLVVGLGGGALANLLVDLGFNVDACDIDPRMYQVAKRFFHLNSLVNYIEGDARVILKRSSKLYDIVIYDVYKAEETPVTLITSESINELNKSLNKNAIVVLNTNGYVVDEIGKGTRSIAKTIQMGGYDVFVQKTNLIESQSNTLLYATKSKFDFNLPLMNTHNAVVLTDKQPILDLLNAQASIQWRLGYIKTYIREMNQAGIPLFW